MPRKLGDKDKKKRKSRKLLVNSALLGVNELRNRNKRNKGK
jgi:hypothetical protein